MLQKAWNPPKIGSSGREGMPDHCFLLPGKKKFPYKTQRNGKWVISRAGLRAAMRRAKQHGYSAVYAKAKALLSRHGGGEETAKAFKLAYAIIRQNRR